MAKSRDDIIDTLRRKHVREATVVSKKTIDAVAKVVNAINTTYGANTLVPLYGSRTVAANGIRTGWGKLDDLLTGDTTDRNRTIDGTGVGIPRGRIIEVYGPEAAGKTTLVLHLIKAVQEAGGTAAYVDAEHSMDTRYADNIGVNLKKLLFSQPDSAEQALDVVIALVKDATLDMVVVDSVAALEPAVEDDADMKKSHVALQARLMSKALRKLTAHVSRANCVVVFVNQIRMKIGVMFGNPETTPGGQALKFYSSIRLDIRKVKTLKKGNDVIGIRSRIKTVKNKAASPFREIYVDIKPNEGITEMHSGNPLAGE